MDDPAIVLDGYLDDQTLPDDLHGATTAFQLVVSPTDDRIDELVMPCHTADPALAHTVLHELGASDLLRVTGYLQLPRTPGDGLRLYVTVIVVLESGCDLASVDTDDDLAPEALSDTGLGAARRSQSVRDRRWPHRPGTRLQHEGTPPVLAGPSVG
ncbi:hypothetical protein [Streptomyces sp. NPDC127066]|uniref:hypothetical protein n=1 Tax=Streptomyces sp. NPDC127066 TaxID=3347125 RepID=UPI00364C9ABD